LVNEPIIVPPRGVSDERMQVDGQAICIHEWTGSGPATLHVHHEDDEAWHVLEGELRFRFSDRSDVVTAGSTVFVPAGVPHTYEALPGARYLIILTPRLRALIAELQSKSPGASRDVYRRHASELLE
jgi:mannose-6-phosphate isomerase-like protein (cupin superfamily)